MQAVWNNQVLAESDVTREVEHTTYFPPESVIWKYFTESPTIYQCPIKGLANYYTLEVEDKIIPDAAWSYHKPNPVAQHIKDYVAFHPRVELLAH